MSMRPMRACACALAALACHAVPALSQAWAAFAAPEIPQSHLLFDELARRMGSDPRTSAITLRFVALPEIDGPEVDAIVGRALAQRPRALFATSTRIALAAKSFGAPVPVIFSSVADPVRAGLVDSLSRPGGNLTGFTYDTPVEGKQFELLRELAPRAKTFGVLEDGHWLGERIPPRRLAEYEAETGAKIRVFRSSSAADMCATIARERRVDAWLVPISNTAAMARGEIASAMRLAGRPAVYGRGFFVDAGGLASYQEVVPAPMEIWQGLLRTIAEGVPAGEIPIQRPKQFELALSLEQAAALGIQVPGSLLRRADRIVAGRDKARP